MSRRQKYLKHTDTLRAFPSRCQKGDSEVCEIDVPRDSHDKIESQHKLREVHVVLQRLRVLPERVKARACKSSLSKRSTLEVNSGDLGKNLLATTCLSKQISTSDVALPETTLSTSCSTSQTLDLKNNSLLDAPQETEPFLYSPVTSTSPNFNNQSVPENRNKNVEFSTYEALNTNLKSEISLCPTISENECKKQSEDNPVSSGDKKMIVQNKRTKKKGKKSSEISNASFNKELRNLLSDKLEEKYDLIFTASNVDSSECSSTRITRSSVHPVTDRPGILSIEEREIFKEKDSDCIENEEKISRKKLQICSQSVNRSKNSVEATKELYKQKSHFFFEVETELIREEFDGSNANAKIITKEEVHNKSNLDDCCSLNLNEVDSSNCLTKDVSLDKLDKDSTKQNGKEEESLPSSGHGWSPQLKEPVSSQNDQSKQIRFDANSDKEGFRPEEDTKLKLGSSDSENGECFESTNNVRFSSTMQLSSLQNEKQEQSSSSAKQESQKFEHKHSENDFSEKVPSRRQTRFTSRASFEKAKSSIKLEYRPKNVSENFGDSEPDALHNDDTEHSVNDNCGSKESTAGLPGTLNRVSKRKVSEQISTETFQNNISSKSVHDTFADVITDVTSTIEDKFANAKIKRRKIVRGCSISKAKQILSPKRCLLTSSDSCKGDSTNNDLHNKSNEDQELLYDTSSAIVNVEKEKSVEGLSFSTTKQKKSLRSNVSFNEANSTREKSVNSKYKKLSNDSESAFVEGTKTITSNTSMYKTRKPNTSRSSPSSSIKSTRDSNKNNSPCVDLEVSQDSSSKITNGKIVTDGSSSGKNKKRAVTTSDSNSGDLVSALLEEIPIKDKEGSNVSQPVLVKGKTNKKETDLPISEVTITHAKSSLHQEIPFEGGEINKNCDSKKVEEKEGKIVQDMPLSTINKKPAFNKSDIFNSDDLNASIEEFPNPDKVLLNVSKDLVVKEITNKKIATSLPTQKHVIRKRVMKTSSPKSLLEEFPIKDQQYKYTESKISIDKKERIVPDMAPGNMNKNQAFNTTDSFNGSLLSISKEGVPSKNKAISKISNAIDVKRKTIKKDADTSKSKQIQKLDLRKRVPSLPKCSSEEIPSGNQEFSLDFDSKITKDRKEKNVQKMAPFAINQKLSFIPCNNTGNLLSVSTEDEDEVVKEKTNKTKLDTLTSLSTQKNVLRTRLSSSPKSVLKDIPIEDKVFSKVSDSNKVQQEKIIQDVAPSTINQKLVFPQSDAFNGDPLNALVRGNKDTALSYHTEALVNKEKLNKKDIDIGTPKRSLRRQSSSSKSSLKGNPIEDQGFSMDFYSKIPKEKTIQDVATSSINEKRFLNSSASFDGRLLSASKEEIPNKDKALSNDSEALTVKGKSNKKSIDVSVSKRALRKRISSSFKSSLEEIPIAHPEISKDSDFNKDLTEKDIQNMAPTTINKKLSITTSETLNSDPLSASMGSIPNKDKVLSNSSGDVIVKEKTSEKDRDISIHRKRASSSFKSSFQAIPIEDIDFSKDSNSKKAKEKKENIVIDRSASIALNQKPTLSAVDSFDSSHLTVSIEKIPNENKTFSNSSIAVNLRKRDSRRRVSALSKHTNFNVCHFIENTLSKDQAISKDSCLKNEMKKIKENAKELLSTTEQTNFTSSNNCRIPVISSSVEEVPKKCQNPSNYSECEAVKKIKNEIDPDTLSTDTRPNLASSKRRVYSPNKSSSYMDIISSSEEVQNDELMRSKAIPVAIVKRKKKKIAVSSKSSPLAKRNHPSSLTELDNDVITKSSFEDITNKDSEHKSDSESNIVSGIKIIDKNISKPTTRQKSLSKRRVSNLSNDLDLNNSLEEIQPKTQEIISETPASAFIKKKKRKIDIFSSLTKQNFDTENQICISSQSTDNIKIQSEKHELLMDSDTATPTSRSKRIIPLSAKKSRNLIDIDVIKGNAANVVKNKKACINKNINLKIKLLKKRRKKTKSGHTFRRKIASKWKDKYFSQTEWSKTIKPPEFQLEKLTLAGNCNSDKGLIENFQNVSLPLISSTDINVRNKILESKTQTSIETFPKVTSDDHNSLKEEITSTNLLHVMERSDTSNFRGDSSETFSSSNNLKAIHSVPSTSDFQREHPGRKYDTLKGSITNLQNPKGQSSDHQISTQVLNVDLFYENVTDTSPDATEKEIPTKIINQESSIQEQTESNRNLETINISDNSITSHNNSNVDFILPEKEVQDILSEIVRQVEIESNTYKSFRAEVVEEPFKVDLSLTVLNALKSTKLALLPTHKAKMATYLLKQLIINHPPKKQSNEVNKLEKAKSEPTLYIPFDLFAEEKNYKKGNERLYNKPENVQKVTSSTSTKENAEEHTFKIPIKAAPKAKKKSVCAKSSTFLKPKANEYTVFLPQKVSSNMRGKVKLYSPGTIQRKLISEPLLNGPSNRNGKKIDISSHFHGVRKPSVSKTYLKHMPELRQVNKTLVTERRSTLQLRNVSPLHCRNKSQVYNQRDIARTGTDINASAPDANALHLPSSIKKQNDIEIGKQNNEIFLKHNLLVCSEACDRKKTSNADKGITGSDVNKIESQSLTSMTTDKCSKQNDIRPSESSSSSDEFTLINSNSDKKVSDNFSKIQNESISCINKEVVTLTNQITDSSNFTMITPTKLKGTSYKSVEPRSSTEDINKSEEIVSEKGIGQGSFVIKSKSSKTTTFKDAETSNTPCHLKQPATSQRTDKDIYSGLSSESNVHPHSKDLTKQNKKVVLKMTKKSCSNEHASKQKHAPVHKFQNEISKEPTAGQCTSNLKSSSESKNDRTSKEISSSKISIPFKENSEKFTNASLKNENSTSEIQRVPRAENLPLKENLTTESSGTAQDTSPKISKLAAQVCELISDLRNLDETTAVAVKNYNNSIKNDEISKELKGMMLREGLTPNTLPDRPPEWFLKFIANFRKQELWRLHQMFKIHDHLMRIESAKLNVLEKVFEELKEKEGIRDD